MSSSTYTLPEVAALVGVEYRTLHSWVERGLVRPSRPARGTGRPAVLSERDLSLCDLLGRLRKAGCGFPILETAAGEHRLMKRRIVLDLGGGVVLTAPNRTSA